MSEPSIVVRCPHCGHPYPLTDLQREVYRGRTMGCVNCGRPIHVDAAIAAQFPAVTAGAGVGLGGPIAGTMEGEASAGADTPHDAAAGLSLAGQASAGDPAATFAPVHGGPSGPAAAAPLKPNTAAVVSLTSGIVFVVLLGMAAIAGYVAADAATEAGGDVVTYVLLASGAAAGVVAIGCGWLGLARSRRPLVGGRSAAMFGLGLGAVGLLVGGCVMSTLLPNLHRARERADREACQNNLQQIASAIGSYAAGDPARRYPDSLDQLVQGAMLTPSVLVCPAGKLQPGTPTTAPSTVFPSSYIYLGRGRTSTSVGPTVVLAYEQPPGHRGGVHVLFADGVVGLCPNPQAAQMARELQSGQNPAPSAVAARQ
jgi:prepilin-type processing-associated H-X9-DG protein